ncbi:metalloprotease [Auriculariales sp. MPI-PUGE-AT-0066]|nr:metalloprotease [Auriculariales sp. MPI-PUGE-AT-0066]
MLLLSSSIILALSAATATFASAATSADEWCGATTTTEFNATFAKEIEDRVAAGKATHVTLNSFASSASSDIPVYFHVITATDDKELFVNGYLTPEEVDAQIAVLNRGFASVGVTFTLAELDYYTNKTWFDDVTHNSAEEIPMKNSTRKGGVDVLNVWTVGFTKAGISGYSSFPWEFEENPIVDGIMINVLSLPGGPVLRRSLGLTLVHETGHWSGLYHTFLGGCAETDGGDLVDDTPAEAGSAQGCAALEGRDSCPDKPGLDPIHNYMSYSDDQCINEFTPGQIARMADQLSFFRGIVPSAVV